MAVIAVASFPVTTTSVPFPHHNPKMFLPFVIRFDSDIYSNVIAFSPFSLRPEKREKVTNYKPTIVCPFLAAQTPLSAAVFQPQFSTIDENCGSTSPRSHLDHHVIYCQNLWKYEEQKIVRKEKEGWGTDWGRGLIRRRKISPKATSYGDLYIEAPGFWL